MEVKKYKATFSSRSKLWTIWKRSTGWIWPIAFHKDLGYALKIALETEKHLT